MSQPRRTSGHRRNRQLEPEEALRLEGGDRKGQQAFSEELTSGPELRDSRAAPRQGVAQVRGHGLGPRQTCPRSVASQSVTLLDTLEDLRLEGKLSPGQQSCPSVPTLCLSSGPLRVSCPLP